MPERTCTIDGCDRRIIAKNLCHAHYDRQRKGAPMNAPIAPRRKIPLPDLAPRGDLCRVPGCVRSIECVGMLCNRHYQRWAVHRTFDVQRHEKPRDDLERMAMLVDKSSDCWVWTGALDGDGYGKIMVDEVRIGAHVWSYRLHVGPIPPGLELDHVCHSRAVTNGTCAGGKACLHRRCVNPDHLEPVTRAENRRRAIEGIRRGEPDPGDHGNTSTHRVG